MRRSVVTQFMSVRVGALKLNNGKSVLGSSMTKRRNLRRGDD